MDTVVSPSDYTCELENVRNTPLTTLKGLQLVNLRMSKIISPNHSSDYMGITTIGCTNSNWKVPELTVFALMQTLKNVEIYIF